MPTVNDPLAQESTLSSWAGPYVTDMLGRGRALASEPYQGYGGALTAGQSGLQGNAFTGLAALNTPTGMGTAVTGGTYAGVPYTTETYAESRTPAQTLNAYTPQSYTDSLTAAQTLNAYSPQSYSASLTPAQTLNAYSPQSFAASQLAGGLSPAYSPQSFTGAGYTPPTDQQAVDGGIGTYTPASDNVLQQYMTPYLQGALQPQYDAANRQNEIAQQTMQSRYGRAGAFGGGRQAVASAELARGALDRMAGITGTGYQNAFQQAQNQFNTEQNRGMASTAQDMAQFNTEQSRLMADRAFGADQFNTEQARKMADRNQMMSQFNIEEDREAAVSAQNIAQYNAQAVRDMAAQRQNNDYGFSLLNAQQAAGATQRNMQAEQVAADRAQFEEERDDPFKKVQYMQSLLQGLPVETQSYEYAQPSSFQDATSGAGGILALMQTAGII